MERVNSAGFGFKARYCYFVSNLLRSLGDEGRMCFGRAAVHGSSCGAIIIIRVNM